MIPKSRTGQDRLVAVRTGEHPPSRDYRHAFAAVLRWPIRAWTVVTSALTSDSLLASSDTDYLPSESIGALCTLTKHTLASSVCVHANHARSTYDRADEISRSCLISFRVECLRCEVKMEKTRAKNCHGDPLLHVSRLQAY